VHDTFIASYLKDAYTQVKMFDLSGKLQREIEFPGLGTAGGFGGRRTDTETFYSFTSFSVPGTIYRYDMETAKGTVLKAPKVDFNPDKYETQQVFYESKDGTRIPMFITHRKGLKLDGGNPTYLYGYGGFNAAMTPGFSVSNLVWMEMGGVYAMANIRGGGEYGKAWHEAGMKLHKQNCFEDFIAAGEWLVAHQYTRPDKLSIGGGSNGGLLVGACITQRPDLFGAALPAVGVLDMLRFHKFTIGWGWVSDYGSPENPDEFKALYAYSPLHNVKPGTKYPATLVTTGDHDDRVVPAHSFKFAAALQAAQAGSAPTLIRIETKAGHGAGKPTAKIIEEQADRWAFLVRALGVKL
jgi:prolyl oligopeptidase